MFAWGAGRRRAWTWFPAAVPDPVSAFSGSGIGFNVGLNFGFGFGFRIRCLFGSTLGSGFSFWIGILFSVSGFCARLRVPGARCTVLGARCPKPGGRFRCWFRFLLLFDARCPVPRGPRYPVPGYRCPGAPISVLRVSFD